MGKVVKLTVSLPQEAVDFADRLAEEKKTSRSAVIAECLLEADKQKKEADLKEGYLSQVDEDRKIASEAWKIAREIWPEY
jgi:metal-responsive CopG/Arc/MetJ family transcriptional regulator